MELEIFLRESSDNFLEFCNSNLVCYEMHQEVRKIFKGCMLLATYDHLKSPFSNRLITGDLRFNALSEKLSTARNFYGLLLIDNISSPKERGYGGIHGLSTGLGILSRKVKSMDILSDCPSKFLHLQEDNGIIFPEKYIETKIKQSIFNEGVKIFPNKKQKLVKITDSIIKRIYEIYNIYDTTIVKSNESLKYKIWDCRTRICSYLGVPEVGGQVFFLSDLQCQLSQILWLINNKLINLYDLISKSKHVLFKRIDQTGEKCFNINASINEKKLFDRTGEYNIEELIQDFSTGKVIPTTHLIYFIVHLVGGIAHFGNGYKMHIHFNDTFDFQFSKPDITENYKNSINVGKFQIKDQILRNLTNDIMFFNKIEYSVYWREAFKKGTESFNINFKDWLSKKL